LLQYLYLLIPIPFDEAFLRDLQNRIELDDTIPQIGQQAIIALIGQQPAYAFRDNKGIVLQFRVDLPNDEQEIKKAAVLLAGTGVIVAGEHSIPLSGIEVVFYTSKDEPWLALAIAPPWNVANNLRLAPIHPAYLVEPD
jgi:hypothetical protein